MPSLRRLLPITFLAVLLGTQIVAKPHDCAEAKKESQQDLEEFQRLLDQADPPSLHSALHDYSPKKFRHGMFEKDRTAAEVLHHDDPNIASSIVALAKRQTPSNGTTTTPPPPGQPASSSTPAGESPATPSPPIATGTDSNGSPTDVTTASPAAGSPTSAPTTTAETSSSPLVPVENSFTTGSTPAVASGSTTAAPSGSSSLSQGEVVTTTNAQGVTIISTVGGGYSTLSPSGNERTSSTSGARSEQSRTTTSRRTTTLANGSQSTVTAVTVVPGEGADTAAPSGTAGVGSGSGTGTAPPGLQTGVATRLGWKVEALAVVGGAVGVAMMMWEVFARTEFHRVGHILGVHWVCSTRYIFDWRISSREGTFMVEEAIVSWESGGRWKLRCKLIGGTNMRHVHCRVGSG